MSLESLADALDSAMEARRQGKGAVIVTVVANRSDLPCSAARRLLVTEEPSTVGTLDPCIDTRVVADAYDALQKRQSVLRSYAVKDGVVEPVKVGTGAIDIYFDVLHPPPRLVVVGAGHIAVPLVALGKLLEFSVTVLDDRAEYATRERFPQADGVHHGPYREMLSALEIDADTYVVLVTRGHVHDQACLEQILPLRPRYIGMIGSKRRVRTVIDHARANGCDPDALARVYAPIGIDIGASTPAEIAVAIAAEIVKVRRDGSAPSLRREPRARA